MNLWYKKNNNNAKFLLILSITISIFLTACKNDYTVAISNRSNEVITLVSVKVDNKLILSKKVQINPAGENYSDFGFSSKNFKHYNPKKLTLVIRDNFFNQTATHSCVISDDKNFGCLLKVSYKNNNITCACDSYADFSD